MRQLKINKQITNRDSRSIERYLHEIAKEPMITSAEEVELAKRIKAGDEEALAKMVRANLRFVISVAKQYQNLGMNLEDLINEGNLGLIKAAVRFDETRGFKFISYAVWWIRQSILQAAADHARLVRLPLNRISHINKIMRTSSKLEQKFERDPTNEEISDEMEINADDVADSISFSKRHVSMDAPVTDGEDIGLYNFIENTNSINPSDKIMQKSLKEELDRAIGSLNEKEAEIIRLFYGINTNALSIDEISQQLSLTRERVRQIKEKALKKMRYRSSPDSLKSFLQ